MPAISYLALRALGYRFDDCGVMLGDHWRDRTRTTFGVYAPDASLIGFFTGIREAYRRAAAHASAV